MRLPDYKERNFPLEHAVKAAARTELRRKHTDPRTTANRGEPVAEIDHRHPALELPGAGYSDLLGDARFERNIKWNIFRVREARAPAAAVKLAQAEEKARPVVCNPAGLGKSLVVIQKDENGV